MTKPLLQAPTDDATNTYTTLGAVDAYDAPLNCDYAFVIYKETDRSGGAWRVRIRSSQTTGVVFEPAMIAAKAREAGAQGKSFFTWGAGIDPTPGDQRRVEYRVHQAGGRPSSLEIMVQMRKFDGAADEAKSISVPWPEALN